MNKFIVAAIAACVIWLGFSPSEALACGPVCQKAYGPGGTAAGNGGGGNFGYYPRFYNYDYPVIVRPRRMKGDPCFTPSGVETAYDPRTKRRYVVPGSGDPNRRQPTQVSAACGDTRYDAIAPGSAPEYGNPNTVTSMIVDGVGLVECRRVQGDNICLPANPRTLKQPENILPQPEAAPPAPRRQPVARQPASRSPARDPGIVALTVDQVNEPIGTLSDYDPDQ